MREIKFRAKYQEKIYLWENDKEKICKLLSNPEIYIGVVFYEFTGLKDKNSKEIYEGDIGIDNRDLKYKIIFKEGKFCVRGLDEFNKEFVAPLYNYNLKVIGNIYENPEMLENKRWKN